MSPLRSLNGQNPSASALTFTFLRIPSCVHTRAWVTPYGAFLARGQGSSPRNLFGVFPLRAPNDSELHNLFLQVHHFYEYFRISEFKREELPDGWVYRKMVVHDDLRLPGWGPHKFVERIKADKETGEGLTGRRSSSFSN